MSKSVDLINPVFPRDNRNNIREGNSETQLERATLVVFNGHRNIEVCDTSNDDHFALPVGIVWVDGLNRNDVPVVDIEGSTFYQHTVLANDCVCDVFSGDIIFDDTPPVRGDVILKSQTNPGLMKAYDKAALAGLALTAEELDALKVGVCEGESPRPGMVRIRFTLG